MIKVLAPIVAILIIVIVAIFNDIDGVLVGSALTILGGLGGFQIGKKRKSS